MQINLSDLRGVDVSALLIPITSMPVDPFAAARAKAKSRNRSRDKPTSSGFTAKVWPTG